MGTASYTFIPYTVAKIRYDCEIVLYPSCSFSGNGKKTARTTKQVQTFKKKEEDLNRTHTVTQSSDMKPLKQELTAD